ncbi:MAG: RNA methyltransferase [Acidimicrobiaceae bacterium]|nr:RNA methyltransferase [Acidimicrobiaceae bacterium]
MRRLRRLLSQRSERWSEGVCVIEGPDLIDAALESRVPFEALYIDHDARERVDIVRIVEHAEDANVRIFALAPGVLDRVANATSPQPVMAAVRFSMSQLTDVALTGLVLVLDNLRDPGNAGTIIRSGDAAGVSAIVLSGDCVDPFNPKTLRASAGSVFHVPLVIAPLDDAMAYFREHGVRSYATVVKDGLSYLDCHLAGPCVVVIGNESGGLSEVAVGQCDERMTIEMAGRAESLNAGVAASLIAFESLRQRRGTTMV